MHVILFAIGMMRRESQPVLQEPRIVGWLECAPGKIGREHQIGVVLQPASDARQIVHDRDTQACQMFARPDARPHQQGRALNRAGR